jgi:hypothetical protein
MAQRHSANKLESGSQHNRMLAISHCLCSVSLQCHYAMCRYAKCRFADRRGAAVKRRKMTVKLDITRIGEKRIGRRDKEKNLTKIFPF